MFSTRLAAPRLRRDRAHRLPEPRPHGRAARRDARRGAARSKPASGRPPAGRPGPPEPGADRRRSPTTLPPPGSGRAPGACRAHRRPDARAPASAPRRRGPPGCPAAAAAGPTRRPSRLRSRLRPLAVRLATEVGQERLDVRGMLHGSVGPERDLRRRAQIQMAPEPVPDEAPRALERLERRRPLLLGPEHGDVDLRVLQIRGHVHLGDRDEAQARVLQLPLEEHGDLHLEVRDVAIHVILEEVHRLGDHLVGVAGVAGHARQGQGGALPGVVVIDLGHRDLEAVPELFLEALQGVALPLQGPDIGQVQLHRTDRNARRRHVRRSYSVRATSSVVKASMMSPGCTPLMPSTPIPHSRPCSTSRTSSLKRLSELTVLSPSTVSPRLIRTRAPRTILPSVTLEPKTVPTLVIGKSWRTWARPRRVSRISGASMPLSAAFTSLMAS